MNADSAQPLLAVANLLVYGLMISLIFICQRCAIFRNRLLLLSLCGQGLASFSLVALSFYSHTLPAGLFVGVLLLCAFFGSCWLIISGTGQVHFPSKVSDSSSSRKVSIKSWSKHELHEPVEGHEGHLSGVVSKLQKRKKL